MAFAASLALLQGAPNAGAASPPAVLPDRPADETDLLSDFNVRDAVRPPSLSGRKAQKRARAFYLARAV